MKKHIITAAVLLVLLTSGCTNITPADVELAKTAILNNDSSKCLQISDSTAKDVCVMTIAQTTKNPSLCDKVDAEAYKDSCLASLAMSTQNPLLCERLSKEKDKLDCKKDVGNINTEALTAFFET